MNKINLFNIVLFCSLLCSCPSDDSIMEQDSQITAAVTAELLTFQFTPDTGNSTSKLEYEIKFTNPNMFLVNGFTEVTVNIDGLESTRSESGQCAVLSSSSECIYRFSAETPFDLGMIQSIEFVGANYRLTE